MGTPAFPALMTRTTSPMTMGGWSSPMRRTPIVMSQRRSWRTTSDPIPASPRGCCRPSPRVLAAREGSTPRRRPMRGTARMVRRTTGSAFPTGVSAIVTPVVFGVSVVRIRVIGVRVVGRYRADAIAVAVSRLCGIAHDVGSHVGSHRRHDVGNRTPVFLVFNSPLSFLYLRWAVSEGTIGGRRAASGPGETGWTKTHKLCRRPQKNKHTRGEIYTTIMMLFQPTTQKFY